MLDFLKNRWVYHILIWIFGFALFELLAWPSAPEADAVSQALETLVYTVPLVPMTYLNFYLKAKLYDKRKYTLYFLSVPFQILVSVGIYQSVYLLFGEVEQPIVQDFTIVIAVIFMTTGLQYLKRGIVGQYQLQELRAKTAQIELNSLKAQINPHFLFNTLNNIYATNQIDAEKGSDMIMELSEVMRYHLHFSKLDKVPLEDELQLAESYIALEKLRLNDNCEVTTDIQDIDNQLQIAPLLLLPFLENAFKHGTHPTRPSFVKLYIRTEKKQVHFEISNSLIEGKKTIRTEIGQANTRRRLVLIYPEKHELHIDKTATSYCVRLTLHV